jgi:hypothetical protein
MPQTASLQLELLPGTLRFTQISFSQNDVRPRTSNAERPEYIRNQWPEFSRRNIKTDTKWNEFRATL